MGGPGATMRFKLVHLKPLAQTKLAAIVAPDAKTRALPAARHPARLGQMQRRGEAGIAAADVTHLGAFLARFPGVGAPCGSRRKAGRVLYALTVVGKTVHRRASMARAVPGSPALMAGGAEIASMEIVSRRQQPGLRRQNNLPRIKAAKAVAGAFSGSLYTFSAGAHAPRADDRKNSCIHCRLTA